MFHCPPSCSRALPSTLLLSASLACSSLALAENKAAIESKAEALVKETTAYLAGLNELSVQIDVTEDKMMNTGLKLMFHRHGRLALQRPDKLKASRQGMLVNQELVYDGKQLSLYGKNAGVYATVDAPATIDETLDFAVEELGAYLPARDLFYSDALAGLKEGLEGGYYVGVAPVNGQSCHHLVFRGPDVDWQIWVRDGEKPLPCKYVITSKWITGAPKFAMSFSDWNTEPQFTADEFTFQPPAGAKRVEVDSAELKPQDN